MKKTTLILFFLAVSSYLIAQQDSWSAYESSDAHPYGMKHPDAPEQLDDFKPMIGTCDCKSLSRNQDGSWQDTTQMVWTFKYVLNGTAIQDLTWHETFSATSIRQFQPDSLKWVVTYASSKGISLKPGAWVGEKEEEEIVLRLPQKAPNGMDGARRLTFTNISEKGFDWRGEWVNEEQGIVYPFWLIWCEKRTSDRE